MRWVGAIACAVLFFALAAAVMAGLMVPFDTAIRAALHRQAGADLTKLALLFSLIGSAWIWLPATVLIIAVLWFTERHIAAFAMIASMAGAVVLDNGLKTAFHRARPGGFFVPDPQTYSFPSGHALFAACFYGALAAMIAAQLKSVAARTALWAGAMLVVLCIGLSRIYLGVHYPSDVVASYIAGAAWLAVLNAAGFFRPANPLKICDNEGGSFHRGARDEP